MLHATDAYIIARKERERIIVSWDILRDFSHIQIISDYTICWIIKMVQLVIIYGDKSLTYKDTQCLVSVAESENIRAQSSLVIILKISSLTYVENKITICNSKPECKSLQNNNKIQKPAISLVLNTVTNRIYPIYNYTDTYLSGVLLQKNQPSSSKQVNIVPNYGKVQDNHEHFINLSLKAPNNTGKMIQSTLI